MNKHLVLILEKAQQSLDAAKVLADQGFFDFAASRAYYAMFYTAEAEQAGDRVAWQPLQ